MKKFTRVHLIESIAGVAMFGILVWVVVASLRTAQTNDVDGEIISTMGGIKASAQVYYQTNGNYGGAHTSCTEGMFGDRISNMSTYTDPVNYPNGLSCRSTNLNYAVQAPLSLPGQYWCVDSSGASKRETQLLTGEHCL